jgi:hypothetical protein
MILSYIDSKGIPHFRSIIKFWQGLTSIKYEYVNGQVIEVEGVKQCFIYEGITIQQEGKDNGL